MDGGELASHGVIESVAGCQLEDPESLNNSPVHELDIDKWNMLKK
jgi:hypothetical protein